MQRKEKLLSKRPTTNRKIVKGHEQMFHRKRNAKALEMMPTSFIKKKLKLQQDITFNLHMTKIKW